MERKFEFRKKLTHLRSSERRWIGLVASLNKAFSQYYSMAKDTWIDAVGEFVSCRSGVEGVGWLELGVVSFFEATLTVVDPVAFFAWSLTSFNQMKVS